MPDGKVAGLPPSKSRWKLELLRVVSRDTAQTSFLKKTELAQSRMRMRGRWLLFFRGSAPCSIVHARLSMKVPLQPVRLWRQAAKSSKPCQTRSAVHSSWAACTETAGGSASRQQAQQPREAALIVSTSATPDPELFKQTYDATVALEARGPSCWVVYDGAALRPSVCAGNRG